MTPSNQGFLRGIGINVILLGIVSFLNDVSSDMMLAVLPMFIASLGGAGIAIGLIGGLGDSIASILKVFSGYWSDRLGRRKPFVFWGYLTSSVAKLFFPLSRTWLDLLVLRPIERVGKGLRTAPRDALIASSALEETRGKAFGIHRAADTSGAFTGVLLTFIFYWFLKLDFKPILLISAVLAFCSLTPLLFVKEEIRSPKRLDFKIGLATFPRDFRIYLSAATIFALGNFTYMFFVLRAKDTFAGIFAPRLSTAIPILLYMWFNVTYALFSIPSGILSDKIGRKRPLLLGYVTYILTCIGFAWFGSLGFFILFFGTYGLSLALIDGNQRAFASDFVSEDLRGTALGTFHTAISLAVLPAGIIAGVLWNYSPHTPFIYGAAMAALAAIIIVFVKPPMRLKTKEL